MCSSVVSRLVTYVTRNGNLLIIASEMYRCNGNASFYKPKCNGYFRYSFHVTLKM